MKKAVVLAVVLFAAVAGYTQSITLETIKVSFANNTTAKLDTVNDTIFCAISQLHRGSGKLAEKMALHLPAVSDAGTVSVLLRLLPNALLARSENKNSRTGNTIGDNVLLGNVKASDYGKTLNLGTFANTDGAKSFTWSPSDSAAVARVAIMLVKTADTPVITGADSLATSNVFVTQTYKE